MGQGSARPLAVPSSPHAVDLEQRGVNCAGPLTCRGFPIDNLTKLAEKLHHLKQMVCAYVLINAVQYCECVFSSCGFLSNIFFH